MTIENEQITNAKQFPAVFYARHMVGGVAQYEKERILFETEDIKNMLPTFVGKPVYIEHRKVDLERIREEADGYVVDSFYNELDGWFWVKFLAVSDAMHTKIAEGWSVSNGYMPTKSMDGGSYINVPYNRRITHAYFTHLAVVDNPRYEGAKIFTPEEFKAYQEAAKAKINEINNSKDEGRKMFSVFKSKKEQITQIDPDAEIEISKGRIMTMKELVNAVKNSDDKKDDESKDKENSDEDEKSDKEEPKPEAEKVNDATEYTVDGGKKTADELVSFYNSQMKKNSAEADKSEDKDEKSKDNESDEDKKDKEEEKTNSKHFEELHNAHRNTTRVRVDLPQDQVARGKSRYGSAN